MVQERIAPVSAEPLVTVKVAPFNAESPIARLADDVTPTPNFYVRSNFKLPRLDAATHRVAVEGAVENRLSLGLDDLKALGVVEVTTTMECAGNNRMALLPLPQGEPWLGGAVSTGRWRGVPLNAVLARAGVKPGTIEILVEGADRGKPSDGPPDIPFARSLPLDKAVHPDTILAFELNGGPLPPDHGFPLRLVVPRWYGMAGVKWVSRIEALTEPFAGYYQRSRYIFDYGDGQPPAPVTTMRVKSTIASPLDGEIVPVGPLKIRGRAWSGAGHIVKVEVAIDGGDTWQEATVYPPVSEYAWQAWEWTWDASGPGRHAIRSRATDAAGNVQPDVARWNKYGYGANGVNPITVNVG
ncbi:MAG TPA: sulfite oxidase [Chloroflexota bacterium]|nr:sulfite oxidase [Chloroflexota bacterium]